MGEHTWRLLVLMTVGILRAKYLLNIKEKQLDQKHNSTQPEYAFAGLAPLFSGTWHEDEQKHGR